MSIISLIAFLYIVVFAIGMLLSVYYLYKEKGISDRKEFLHLLFFAPTGLGNWKYNSILRSKHTAPHSKNWYTYTYLLRVNWCLVTALLAYEVYTLYHVYQLFTHYNEFKDTASATLGTTATDIIYSSFGWMMDLSINIVLGFMAIVIVFSLIVCILLFILLPRLLLKKE